ncbi:MAG: hypothetical protein M1832_000366 [Thelocarpon impressellum]|nr:MAG: hypothetical protein M1832_000366 [Thelocarpon impressellum]
MSAPTQQFSHLHIGGDAMPTTRAQHRTTSAASSSRSSEPEEEGGSRARAPGSPRSAASASDAGDGREQRVEARPSGGDGPEGEFRVQYCREFPPQPHGYYAFRLVPTEAQFGVRIGGAGSPYATPRCSCQVFRHTQSACQHVFWLGERLRAMVPERADVQAPFELLSSLGLRAVARELGWPYVPQAAPAPDEETFSRRDQVRDMLSTFDRSTLPEQYLAEAYASADDDAPGEPAPSDGLETLIFRLALHDETFYRPLREAVSADHCASVYFGKLLDETRRLFALTDAFYRTGEGSPAEAAPDVAWCAQALRRMTRDVRGSLELRAPLGDAVKSKACYLLLTMLDGVCERDADVSAPAPAPAPAPAKGKRKAAAAETRADNLFTRLIREAAAEEHFVVPALWDLRPVARDHTTLLDEVLDKLAGRGAPAAYVAELTRFVQQLDAGDEPTGGLLSRGKRTGAHAHEGRGAQKRMK